jgi:hypothetical protein
MRQIIKPDHRTVMRLLIGNDEGRRTHERVVRGLRQRRREYARGSDASFAWYYRSFTSQDEWILRSDFDYRFSSKLEGSCYLTIVHSRSPARSVLLQVPVAGGRVPVRTYWLLPLSMSIRRRYRAPVDEVVVPREGVSTPG